MNTVEFNGLELHPENRSSDAIEVIYEKHPIVIEPGSFPNGKTEIDLEPTEDMQRLGTEAVQLKELPELDRLPAILDLLRSNIEYPYAETLEQLQDENAALADWIKDRLLPEGSGGPNKLSEVIEKGYGVCNELSVAYLWLAQHAGLSGVLLRSDYDQITNINRADSDKPLFRETPLGGKVPAHAWVEIRTKSRGWVPVDPSTRYIGDTDEKLQTFHEAGYMAHMVVDGLSTVEPVEALKATTRILPVPPASEVITGETRVGLHEPRIKIGGAQNGHSTPPNHESYSGNATVTFHDTARDVGLKFAGFKKN